MALNPDILAGFTVIIMACGRREGVTLAVLLRVVWIINKGANDVMSCEDI
jgi:hypothetical protein